LTFPAHDLVLLAAYLDCRARVADAASVGERTNGIIGQTSTDRKPAFSIRQMSGGTVAAAAGGLPSCR
jgi:hypothetical protein